MISTAAGPGAVYLTEEEELAYEWYREIVYSGRRTGRVFKRDLRPFALAAAVIITHNPHNQPGARYDIHLFGLRSGDRERSYIPADTFFERLTRGAADSCSGEIPPITPRYSWPCEALTLDEIRQRFTSWIADPALRRTFDGHNHAVRTGAPRPAPGHPKA